MTTPLTTLYRPVGYYDIKRIMALEMRAYPSCLPAPCCSFLLDEKDARDMAERYDTVSEKSGYAGFVTKIDVDSDFLVSFEVYQFGQPGIRQYRILAEEMEAFNRHIQGLIQVIAFYLGERYQGPGPKVIAEDLASMAKLNPSDHKKHTE